MRTRLAMLLLAGLPMTASAQTPFAPHVPDVLRGQVGPTVEATFAATEVDLDGDGRPEIVAMLSGADFCGAGGCTLLVLAGAEASYRPVARVMPAALPVRLLAEASHGWRDLAAGSVRLRFDGQSYAAVPLAVDAGAVMIAAGAPERQLPRRD